MEFDKDAFYRCYAMKDYEGILSLNLSDIEIAQSEENGFYQCVFDILENCPNEVKERYPKSLIQLGLELFSAGFFEEYRHLCSEIKLIIYRLDEAKSVKDKLYGELKLLYSFSLFNDIEKMCMTQKQAYQLLNGHSASISPSEPWTFGSPSVLYMFHSKEGRLEQEVDSLVQSLPIYSKMTKGHGAGADYCMLSEMCLYQGKLEEAEVYAHQSMHEARQNEQESILLCGLFILLRISIVQGNLKRQEDYGYQIEEIKINLTKKSLKMTIDLINTYEGNILCMENRIPQWMKVGDIQSKRLFYVSIPYAQMEYFHYRLLKKDYKWIISLSSRYLEDCIKQNFLLPQIYILIDTASAYYSLGNIHLASITIKKAYGLATSDRLYLPFAENWERIGRLITEVGMGAGFIVTHQILELALLVQSGIHKSKEQIHQQQLPYSLTKKEYEVAKLAACGFQNKEIAQTLFLSENTVKQYMKHIFVKCNISKRNLLKHLL